MKKARNSAVAPKKRVKAVKKDGMYRNNKPTLTPLNRGLAKQTARQRISCNESAINKSPRRSTMDMKQAKMNAALVSTVNLAKLLTSTNIVEIVKLLIFVNTVCPSLKLNIQSNKQYTSFIMIYVDKFSEYMSGEMDKMLKNEIYIIVKRSNITRQKIILRSVWNHI